MVSSRLSHDTPDLSDSMRRRLAKENEAINQEQQQQNRYPFLSADGDDDDEEDDLKTAKQSMPNLPNYSSPAGHAHQQQRVPWAEHQHQQRMNGRRSNGQLQQAAASSTSGYKRASMAWNDDPDYEGKVGCFRLASEWITSLFLDTCLIAFEFMVNIWLALLLQDRDMLGQYQGIVILFFVPSCVNAILWVKLSKSYKKIGFLFMLAVAFFGFPSPLLVCIWHLYISAFCNQADSQRSRILSNTFRIVHAFTCSLPLILLNLYTLLSILKVEGKEKDALDISQLTKHLDEVKIHGFAAILSFINVLRAASLFNERQTFTLLFVLVGYPYLLFTILSRILAIGVIACFMDVWWIVVLFAGLVLTNLTLYLVCRKRPRLTASGTIGGGGGGGGLPSRRQIMKTVTIRGDIEEQLELRSKLFERQSMTNSSGGGGSNSSDVGCCSKTAREETTTNHSSGNSSWQVAVEEESFCDSLPKLLLMSVCSIVVPLGYTNDYRSHHPRIKGGLFILLNYLFNMLWIGLALGFTIVNDVPNTFHGVAFPQPSLKVEVPGSKVIVQAGGLDVALNLPNTRIDLGSMPTFSATLNTDSTDVQQATLIPIVLAIVVVPFVIMRAAMMELDCFLARKKQLEEPRGGGGDGDEADGGGGGGGGGVFFGRKSLGEAVKKNWENKELKARLYLTVCCSMCGMCVFTVLMVLTGVFMVISLH